MSSAVQIPARWALVSLGTLAESMRNGIYKPDSEHSADGVPTLRMYNIAPGGKLSLHNLRRVNLSPEELVAFGLLAGDLLVNRVNSRELVGKSCLIPDGMGPLSYESKNIRVRVRQGYVAPAWVHHWLQTRYVRAEFEAGSKATTGMATLDQGQLGSLSVPFPPLPEQNRIIDKLAALQSSSHRVRNTLSAVPALLERLRQSILAAAFRGDLTADWRARNPDVEPADKLLERICSLRELPTARRASRAEAATLSSIETVTHQLPPSWKVTRMGDVARLQPGFAFKSEWYKTSGVRLLRGTNITPGATRWDDVVCVDDSRAAEYVPYSLREGDIVIAMDRPIISGGLKVCRVNHEDLPCLLLQRVGRLIPEPGVVPDFLYLFLQSHFFLKHIDKQATGTQLPHVSGNDIEFAGLPLPPTAEQALIVERVSALFAKARGATRAHAGLASAITALESTVLAKAFRGELVPQDPNDEPASVLLERLRAEAAAAPAKPGRRARAPAAAERPAASSTASASLAAPAPAQARRAAAPAAPVEAAPSGEPAGPAASSAPTPVQQPSLPGIAALDFLELPAATQTERVHALLLGEGTLEREDAVRRAAERLRDLGSASFQRLRRDGTLATCIDAAIAVGLRHNRFDRPSPGNVRALAAAPAEVPPALWRRAVLAALAEPATDADAAVRDAALWSQAQFGLEFQRLRAGGRIDSALRAALAELLAAREVVSDRHGLLSLAARPR